MGSGGGQTSLELPSPLLLLLAPPRTTALNIAQSGFHSQAKKYMPKTRLEYDA